MKKKPWKTIMKNCQVEDAVFIKAFGGISQDTLILSKIDGIDIGKYYNQEPRTLYWALKQRT